ncbi:MAG: hypothetical protein IT379_18955 [Deltaproteobacteria bacterium]|nr:hypothetical protein [Deltaproteobacteria bacterium]
MRVASSLPVALLALGTGLGLAAFARPAAAQEERRQLAIVAEGTGASAVRRAIAGELAELAELASEAAVERATSQTGGDLSAPFGRAALARELEIDVLVRVQLQRSGRNTTATLAVYGADGRPLAERDVTGGPGARGRRTIAEAARDLVQTAITTLEERAAEEERRRQAAARQRRSGEEEEEEEEEEEGDTPPERLAVLAGFGGRVRSLDITLAEGLISTHDSGFFPELSLLVRVRPLATSRGLVRGITAELGGALGLGVAATNPMGEEISSTVIRFHLDAGWVHTMGRLELGAMLGFGLDSFSFDRDDLVPSTSYTYLRLAPVGAFTVVRSGLLKLGLTAGLRLAFGAGDLSDTYGGTPAFGFDLALAASGHVGRFVYGLDLGLWLWTLSFDDDNADGMTGVDGSELSLSAMLRAGYQIW